MGQGSNLATNKKSTNIMKLGQYNTVAWKGVQLIIKIWEFLTLGDSLGHILVPHEVLDPYKAIKSPK